MMENAMEEPEITPTSPEPSVQDDVQAEKVQKSIWIIIGVGIVVLSLLIVAFIFLASANTAAVEKLRDIFIIFMALESFVVGVALVILMVQLAILTNLIQNEVKPILDSTQQTANTLQGTAKFLSDNLTEPVIKLNEYIAVLKEIGSIMNFRKKK
jgi:hypothetical protein